MQNSIEQNFEIEVIQGHFTIYKIGWRTRCNIFDGEIDKINTNKLGEIIKQEILDLVKILKDI